MKPSHFASAMILCALASGPVVAADEITQNEISAALASTDSHVRHEAWKRLNAEKDAHYKALVQILKGFSWYDREGAVIALAKAATDETLKKMVNDLKENSDRSIRQGMADALAKMNDEKLYPHLYEALKDKDPVVRRMVVHYLRVHKRNESVDALVELFQTEKDPVVKSFIVESLNSITQAYQGTNPSAWKAWWKQAKLDPNYKLGKTDEQAEKAAEELGNKIKKRITVSQAGGVELETEERGGGKVVSVPILIIPYYGISKETMKPFLAELEKTNKLFYIDLPAINKFKDLKTATAARVPYYPIDQLVEAFEDLRKATKQERFALLACGYNSWIAMRYAVRYPKSVSHLVLICPISSGNAFGQATQRMEAKGKKENDPELWHLSMSRLLDQSGESVHSLYHKDKKVPIPEGEAGVLDRRDWGLYFRDHRDSLISLLYPIKEHQLGSVAIPDYRCFTEKPKARIPTIVIAGKASILSSIEDCKAIAKHLGGQCFVYENSACMPFAEESTLFNKHMAFLLREKVAKVAVKQKDAKAEADGKDKGKTTTKESKPAKKDEKKKETEPGEGDDKGDEKAKGEDEETDRS